MRITELTAIPLTIPVRGRGPSSSWTAETGRQILVRARTDEGLCGWGGCFAYGAARAVCAVVDELAGALVGEDPAAVEVLVSRLARQIANWGRSGIGLFALGGIELALWDLKGKALGAPVSRLLGGSGEGEPRPVIPAYASLPRYETPLDVAAASIDAVGRGYRSIKLHQSDLQSVAAAREAVGAGVELMLDVNCAWNVDEAIAMGRQLERFDLRWIEEPIWPPEDHDGLRRVRAGIGIPVACGENEATAASFRDVLAASAADVLQPSVLKVGGLLEMQRIAAVASAAGVELAPHSYYFGPGLAASLHFAAACASVSCVEAPYAELAAPVFAEPPPLAAGGLRVPAGPGLGSDPGPEAFARYRR